MTDETLSNEHIPEELLSENIDEEMETDAADMGVETSQSPNSLFRRSLLGGYKVLDVDQYVEKAKEVLDAVIEENKELKTRLAEQDD